MVVLGKRINKLKDFKLERIDLSLMMMITFLKLVKKKKILTKSKNVKSYLVNFDVEYIVINFVDNLLLFENELVVKK